MTWDGPNLPVDLTLTTASDPLTWTRSRLECSAWTLTALFAQVLTAIEPPKLFTSRRAPGPPRNGGARLGQPPGRPTPQNLVKPPPPSTPPARVGGAPAGA